MKAYEYLVYRDAYVEDEEDYEAEVLVEPTLVLAKSEDAVKIKAIRALTDEDAEDIDNVVHVVVREWRLA